MTDKDLGFDIHMQMNIHCPESDNDFSVSFVCYFIIPARSNQNENKK